MTLAVLGLDAADHELAKRWGCENLLLSNHQQLETESYSLDVPATIEVWPTIATGLSPAEHGVVLNTPNTDAGQGYKLAQQVVAALPTAISRPIVQAKEQRVGTARPTTTHPHVFESGAVHNWPGVTNCEPWTEEGHWFTALNNGEISTEMFQKRYLIHLGEQLGWLSGAAEMHSVAGIHLHILDHMGHIYAERPAELRDMYEVVDEFVGWLRGGIDELLIISDHGMQTSELNDGNPGVHSWRALVSSTLDGELPMSVRDVAAWIREHTNSEQKDCSHESIDAPIEHLEDLGYL